MKIIFDYNRTIYNPETGGLYSGVFELLKELSEKNSLYLVSRNEPERNSVIKSLGVDNFFKQIKFVDQKTEEIFKEFAAGKEMEKVLIIGDRIKEEIAIGNKLGFITIWFKQGKFSSELPESEIENPQYIIKNINELMGIINKYE